jgi:WD40 repeat protein
MVQIWSTKTRKEVVALCGHKDIVWCMTVSPDGQQIASCSANRTIQLWDVTTQHTVISPLRGHKKEVVAITFLLDGTPLVLGSDNQTIQVWDTITSISLQTFNSHKDEVT